MRKIAEMMEGTHKRKSLHDKLLHQWEIENANELGDDADMDDHDEDEPDYTDGFED